ncbi:MAG TPA: Wzz/FepE/Etk N-terminal domain-containing protein [Anaerolineales bacterium]
MELKGLYVLLRQWLWLVAVGLLAGLLSGFIASSVRQPVYESSTKLLVSNELEGKSSAYAGLTNTQLVQTYIQLLKTESLRTAAAEKIGVRIRESQVDVQMVPDTQIIEIRIQADEPDKAALIANTMVTVLINQIETQRTDQFNASETKLSGQIEEVGKQIASLQTDFDQRSQQDFQDQLTKVEKQISDIQAEISAQQNDIARLSFVGTPDSRAQMAQKQLRVEQLQSSYRLYDQIRANLVVLGKPTDNSVQQENPYLEQTRATIDVYQKIRLDLISELEATRSARLQQTPNAVQIQEGLTPSHPVGLSSLVYTILSGVAGVVLAVAVIMFLQILRPEAAPGAAEAPEPHKRRRNRNPAAESSTQ